MHPVTIPLSKAKNFFLLLIACAFVVSGYWMFGLDSAEIESQRRFDSPLFVHGIGLASMACGGLLTFAILRKLMDSSPGLVLDSRGLTDNSSAFSAGFIPWSDIAGFEVRHIQNQRMLYVLLRDPEQYIAAFGPVKRALFKANQKMAASPVAITSSSLTIGFDELVALTTQHLTAYRQDA